MSDTVKRTYVGKGPVWVADAGVTVEPGKTYTLPAWLVPMLTKSDWADPDKKARAKEVT